MKARRVALQALAAALGACVPRVTDDDALVRAPRVLAVRADPAEAKPGSTVVLTPLVAGPDGTVAAPALAWSFCVAPKPLAADTVVSPACLDGASLVPVGDGAPVSAVTPAGGCSTFGPNPAGAGARARDPDATGGYYQPLLADLSGAGPVVDLLRITCDLPAATASVATAFAAAYVPNANPTLAPLAASVDGMPLALAAVPPGARVTLTASWPASSAETYAYYDAAAQTVTTQRESMQVSWYASAGAIDRESTAVDGSDPALASGNTWTAPADAGPAHLWIVLRDSRGGVDFAAYDVVVGDR